MDRLWDIHAVRYARHARRAGANFLGGDPHDGPMPMDYFVWVIRDAEQTILLDTGFDEEAARERGRELVRPVAEGLSLLGVDPAALTDIVISHMHYDHAGNHELFPRATYHLQDTEMEYCTGRKMRDHAHRAAYGVRDVQAMIGKLFADRVVFHDGANDGPAEIAPGITLHHMGGHTAGLQVMRVATKRGYVVLASDAMHYYRNWRELRPFPILDDVETYLAAYPRIEALAESPDHIIPGHDPEVLRLYPPSLPGVADIVRLDEAPIR